MEDKITWKIYAHVRR